MSKKDHFYHAYSSSDTPCHLMKVAYAEAQKTWLCTGCCSPKPGLTAIDARLRLAPSKEPLNFVFGTGLPIARKAFLEALGNELVQRELYIGRVFGPDGQELVDWATFRGKHELIIRGSENVQFRKCAECSRNLYFAMGKRYLYPAPLPHVSLFESDRWGLVLDETTFVRAGVEKWDGIYIDKLSVADFPNDSLSDLVHP